MYNKKYVFSQLFDALDRNDFNYLESLRDVVLATQAQASRAYHLGFDKAATKSNLSKANNNRDYRIFEEFAYHMVAEAQKRRATEIFKLKGKVYSR